MSIIAKHHPGLQPELLALTSSLDVRTLGIWIVRGWNEIFTDAAIRDHLKTVLGGWANQDENSLLKRAAARALSAFSAGTR